ncbi:type I polyketide synthase [Acanthopleuribacter pedis]|uniref:SDR family NAD(P)-dependent oxidoreductase n=1 Tax=Acanthopleuribacter pedis TaxID=442870 RepID=A0A8J7QH18_9BACT|nr:type I polyketide synthase [Acanthopleuribacter pedis]MBO1318460.1 SDR family NAD(P)-dependent oxidoreductase [Acanthopleuribacter pedis]
MGAKPTQPSSIPHTTEAFEKDLVFEREPLLNDHLVHGDGVLPAAAQLEMALTTARAVWGGAVCLRNIVFQQGLVVKPGQTMTLRLIQTKRDNSGSFEILARQGEGPWQSCTTGTVEPMTAPQPEARNIEQLHRACTEQRDPAEYYRFYNGHGIQYGPLFRVIRAMAHNDNQTLNQLETSGCDRLNDEHFLLHPCLMDGALQSLAGLIPTDSALTLPFTIKRLRVYDRVNGLVRVWAEAQRRHGDGSLSGNVQLLGEDGRILAEAEGVFLKAVPKTQAVVDTAAWHHTLTWETGATLSTRPLPAGRWLVFDNEQFWCTQLSHRLRESGAEVISIRRGKKFRYAANEGRVVPGERAHLQALREQIGAQPLGEQPFAGLIFTWQEENATCSDALALAQIAAVFGQGAAKPAELWVLTQQGQPIGERRHIALAAGANIGLARVIRAEMPRLTCRAVDLPAEEPAEAAWREISGNGTAAEVVIRDGKRLLPRITAHTPAGESNPVRKDGIYLITGGMGGIGLEIARTLAENGARTLVLVNRSPLPAQSEWPAIAADKNHRDHQKITALQALTAAGKTVVPVALDISDSNAVGDLVRKVVNHFGNLNGVVHAAGVLRDGLIQQIKADDWHTVFAPKLSGALALAQACDKLELDFFTMFSSATSVYGNLGQGTYAAANAALDALAYQLRAAGVKATALNWSLWSEVGMGTDLVAEINKRGFQAIDNRTGLALFAAAVGDNAAQHVFAQFSGEAIHLEAEQLAAVQAAAPTAPAAPAVPVVADKTSVRRALCAVLAAGLKMETDDFELDSEFGQFGIDSILSVRLAGDIGSHFNVELGPTTFYQYATVGELVDALVDEFQVTLPGAEPAQAAEETVVETEVEEPTAAEPQTASPSTSQASVGMVFDLMGVPEQTASETQAKTPQQQTGGIVSFDPVQPEPAATQQETVKEAPVTITAVEPTNETEDNPDSDAIAVIGMAGRFPGAGDIDSFWQNLRNGVDAVGEVPKERWDVDRWFSTDPTAENSTYSRWGGFLDEIDRFDPEFFRISPREAKWMDPQQRLLLEVAWEACEHAGYAGGTLSQGKTGVYIAASYQHYRDAIGLNNVDVYSGLGNLNAILANRLSYAFGLNGPCMTVDTLCSSSLVAIHLAMQSLRRNESDYVLVGGVHAALSSWYYRSLSRLKALSPNGRCATFDSEADGYVPGEGVAVTLLKRLDRAVADGDAIYGVLRGAAVNHGGRAGGFTVPRVEAQVQVIQDALRDAKTQPEELSYVEAHGTGTALGDPIEVQGLTRAFDSERRQFCALGSVKSNLGHLEPAAGMAGLVKVLKSMEASELPPSLHVQAPNPKIHFENTPFYINNRLSKWRAAKKVAGISAFGMGGVNAHVVIEEAPGVAPREHKDGARVFVLSARSPEALTRMSENMAGWLESNKPRHLEDVFFTANTGRGRYEYRLAVVCQNPVLLAKHLRAVSDDPAVFLSPDDEPKKRDAHQRAIQHLLSHADHNQLKRWCRGTRWEDRFLPMLAKATVKKQDRVATLRVLALLFVNGVDIDWEAYERDTAAEYGQQPRRIALPTYPFERRRFHIEPEEDRPQTAEPAAGLHLLIDRACADLEGARFRKTFSSAADALLANHQLFGQAVLPAAAVMEMVLAAARRLNHPNHQLHDLLLRHPIVDQEGGLEVDLAVKRAENNALQFRLTSDEGRREHARGRLVEGGLSQSRIDLDSTRAGHNHKVDTIAVTNWLVERGLAVGPMLTHWVSLATGDNGFLLELDLGADLPEDVRLAIAVDNGLRAFAALTQQREPDLEAIPVPYSFSQTQVGELAAIQGRLFLVGRRDSHGAGGMTLCDEQGRVLLEMEGIGFRAPMKRTSATEVPTTAVVEAEMDAEGALLRRTWQSAPVTAATRDPEGLHLVFRGNDPLASRIVAGLRRGGTEVIEVGEARQFHAGGNHFSINRGDANHYSRLCAELKQRDLQPAAILVLLCEDSRGEDGNAIADLFLLVQAMLQHYGGQALEFRLVTTGGALIHGESGADDPVQSFLDNLLKAMNAEVPEGGGEALLSSQNPHHVARHLMREALYPASVVLLDPAHAGAHGLLAVLANEAPSWQCSAVSLSSADRNELLAPLLDELSRPVNEVEVALRGNARLVPKLEVIADTVGDELNLVQRGVYLITGGLGGVGLEVARWLARAAKARLALVSRRGLPEDAGHPVHAAMRDMQALGGEVTVFRGDVTDPQSMRAVFDEVETRFGGVDGVFHAAGVVRDGLLKGKKPEDFGAVIDPKVEGTLTLDRLTRERNTQLLVLFSSLSAITGNIGQGDYAAANRFMDAVAYRRVQAGYPTLSINWGLWGGVGMGAELAATTRARGYEPLTTSEALEALRVGLILGGPNLVVPGRRLAAGQPPQPVRQHINPGLEHKEALQMVCAVLQEHLEMDRINTRRPFLELGLDSILAVKLVDDLSRRLELTLPPTLFFDYANAERLADALIKLVPAKPAAVAEPAAPQAAAPAATIPRAPLANHISDIVCRHLELERNRFNRKRPFLELGLDSILAVKMVDDLQPLSQASLPPTLFFDYANVEKLSDALIEHFGVTFGAPDPVPAPAVQTPAPVAKKPRAQEPIVSQPQPKLATPVKPVGPVATPAKQSAKNVKLSAPQRLPQREAGVASGGKAVAVIGMAGRFPGASNLVDFWRNLAEGSETVADIPKQRWDIDAYFDADPNARDRIYTKRGGFLNDIDQFDAAFFRLYPREAEVMDPQQRLALECAWETLENAGYAPDQLAAQRTGIFIGASYNHYREHHIGSMLDAYSGLGNQNAILANRISYFLDLRGPCLTVDTLCSSSLTALQLAIESLRRGECDSALAGGVHAGLSPAYYQSLCRLRAVSPDGRCHTFSKDANGYVPGEGAGLVLLKSLDKALADGDHIHGVIRGIAVSHGGQTSGLTVPSSSAQAELIRRAHADAGVNPASISYVETHGTGTSLGDPIEIAGLTQAFSDPNPSQAPTPQSCAVGSLKSNIGHLEPAAGIAGLIKVLLCLKAKQIPASLHVDEINPALSLENSPFYVNTRLRPWRERDGVRRAGLSSFGLGGVNGHLVLEEAPLPQATRNSTERPLHVLALSGKSRQALRDLAGRYVEQDLTDAVADLCFTAGAGRAHFDHRLAITAANTTELREKLRAWLQRGQTANKETADGKLAWIFTGQGSQWPDMGRGLYENHPVFRATLQQCATVLDPLLEVPLLDLLYGEQHRDLIHQTGNAQPALFALEYALSQLWRAWGVEPDAVLGHSLGEFVAATVAGVLDLDDALRLVAERGRLMQSLPLNQGAMVTIAAGPEKVKPLLVEEPMLSIAALNGPTNTVVSGDKEALARLTARCKQQALTVVPLRVSHAFHSPLMEPILDAFRAAAAKVQSRAPRMPLISNLTGSPLEQAPDADYWCRHLRGAVAFSDGMRCLAESGHTRFLEIGPHPVLVGMGRKVLGEGFAWYHSLERRGGDWRVLLQNAAALYESGQFINWENFDAPYQRRRVTLPTYPFQRKRLWKEATARQKQAAPAATTIPAAATAAAIDLPEAEGFRLHQPSWQAAAPSAHGLVGTWFLLDGDAGKTNVLRAFLTAADNRVFSRKASALGRTGEAARFDAAALKAFVADMAREGAIGLMVHADIAADLDGEQAALPLLQLTRALLAAKLTGLNVAVLTEQETTSHDLSAAVANAIAAEHNPFNWKTICLSRQGIVEACSQIWSAAGTADGSREVLLQEGGIYRRAWESKQNHNETTPLRRGGVYIVPGGLGGLGYAVASDLLERYQTRLVISGRSEVKETDAATATNDKERRLAALRAKGEVSYIAADLSDAEAVTRLVNTARQSYGAVHGVIHAAGVADAPRSLRAKDDTRFQQIVSPKVTGSKLLYQAAEQAGAELVVWFSSVSSLCPLLAKGMSDYAAANEWQNRHALRPREVGAPKVVSLVWPEWQGTGLSKDHNHVGPLQAISSTAGVAAFYHALAEGSPCQIILNQDDPINGDRFFNLPAPTHKIEAKPEPITAAPATPTLALQDPSNTVDLVRGVMAEVLKVDAEELDLDTNFAEMGLDSLLIADTVAALEKHYAQPIEPHVVISYPTLRKLGGFCAEQFGSAPIESRPPAPVLAEGLVTETPIAVPNATAPVIPTPEPAAAQETDGVFLVRDLMAEVLKVDAEDLALDDNFAEMGLDSLLIADTVAALEKHYGQPIEPHVVISYPTLRKLGGFCAATFGPPNEVTAAAHPQPQPETEPTTAVMPSLETEAILKELIRQNAPKSQPVAEAPGPVAEPSQEDDDIQDILRRLKHGDLSLDDAEHVLRDGAQAENKPLEVGTL